MAIDEFQNVKNLHDVFDKYSSIVNAVGLNSIDYKRLKNTEGFNQFFNVTTDNNGNEFWNNIIVTNSPLIQKGTFYLKYLS